MHQRMRNRGRERKVHRAADSSRACKRDADSAKRRRSIETDFRGGGHHQQFFIATLRALQRAGRRNGHDCRDANPRSRFEPQHSAVLGAQRPGLQREFLRDIDGGHDAIGGWKYRHGLGDVHGAGYGAKSELRYGDGNPASGRIEKSASNVVDSDRRQRKYFALDGDAGGESSRDAERAGQRNFQYRRFLEREPPGAIPSPNPVSATAVSAADSTKSASAQITVINHVLVAVQPGSVTLAPLAVQGFTASVLGTSNQNVFWQVQGTACSTAGICGTINPSGTYTAPGAAPAPDAIQVVAVSSDDTSQSGIANVTISTGANILTLHSSSVYAGAAQGFTLRVAGSVSVQIQNSNGTKSNAVALIVAAPNVSDEVIALSSSAPAATGRDIVVVDPTTAGVSVPGNDLDLNVAALGTFNTANNSCTLGGNAIPLPRPASGTSTADICLFSQSGLDTSMTYTVSGPGDVAVIAKLPAGLGIIHLTLQVPATAATGARTLFIQNTNLDKTAASGVLEVH